MLLAFAFAFETLTRHHFGDVYSRRIVPTLTGGGEVRDEVGILSHRFGCLP